MAPHFAVHVEVVEAAPLVAVVERLPARLAACGDVLLVATPGVAPALPSLGLPTVPLAGDAPLAAVLDAASAFAPRASAARSAPLGQLLVAVREAGFLPVERALGLTACADEAELAGRLAVAGVEDVHLVPGVGLYTEAFLHRLQAARATSEVA